jgi:hypothetical protein
MPYRVPRRPAQLQAYNQQLQEKYAATRQAAPYVPEAASTASQPDRDPIAGLKDLAALHESGALSDAEFSAAKAKLLGLEADTS